MTLLNPAALVFAVLVPVIVLLYLLKLRRQPARVSTLMFWQRVTADHRRRALFQRLRQVLSLLLHLLIFALLLLALARPELAVFRADGAGVGSSTVVILDCGARMQAREGGVTHFAQARQLAGGYLRRASAQNAVALLAAGSAPQVLAGFSGDEKALITGLDHARVSDAGGRIEDAVHLADDLLASRAGNRRIVVLTDKIPAVRALPAVEWRLAGNTGVPLENVGLTRLTVRPLPNSPQTDEVLLEIENFGATRQTGSVELTFDGRLLDVKPYDLAPGGRRTEIYPALAANTGLANTRGWLTAHLAPAFPGDALALDDEAYAVIPPPQPLRVLLVTRGNWFLESLFKADEGIEFNQLTPESFQPAQAESFDAVVLDDFLPAGFDALDHLPAGNFLFVRQAPLPGTQTAIDHPLVTEADKDSPLLRLVDLRGVSFLRAREWTLPAKTAGWRFAQPVRALERPLVVTGERTIPGKTSGKSRLQRFVALAFGATDSVELPLHVAFPLFVHNTVAWLGAHDETASGDGFEAAGLRAGETLNLAVGETVWTVPQHTYQALPGKVPPSELLTGPVSFQPARNGFYLRHGVDGAAHWLAVNTFDREVSAVGGLPGESRAAEQPGPVDARSVGGWWEAVRVWPPWIYLACLAFALCTLEWWGFHRRRTE